MTNRKSIETPFRSDSCLSRQMEKLASLHELNGVDGSEIRWLSPERRPRLDHSMSQHVLEKCNNFSILFTIPCRYSRLHEETDNEVTFTMSPTNEIDQRRCHSKIELFGRAPTDSKNSTTCKSDSEASRKALTSKSLFHMPLVQFHAKSFDDSINVSSNSSNQRSTTIQGIQPRRKGMRFPVPIPRLESA